MSISQTVLCGVVRKILRGGDSTRILVDRLKLNTCVLTFDTIDFINIVTELPHK